jgi:ketosteroid isomerase-like protein
MDVEQRLTQYIAAVESNDLEALEDFYDTDFVNVRYDRSGALVTLDRDVFMRLLRDWKREGNHPLPVATETKFITTSFFSDFASSLLLRVKGGQTLSYNMVWRRHSDSWKLVREFTFHESLPTRSDAHRE